MIKPSRNPKKLDRQGLQNYALRLLSGRSYSKAELRTRLERRAADAADVEAVLERASEYGYLDDRSFAENFAAGRRDQEAFGQARVLRDLRRRKVPRKVAEEAVAGAFQGTDETELIEAHLARKFRRTNLAEYLKEPKNLASVYRRLRYAGFGSGSSIRVLQRYSERASELEAMEGDSE